jgi:hypothetical protein
MHNPLSRNLISSSLLHPHALARSLCAVSLHLLHRVAATISAGFRIVALGMSLLAAEAELLVLLCALGIPLAVAVASSARFVGGLSVVVEGDVEEVFFVRVADFCTLTFCLAVSFRVLL